MARPRRDLPTFIFQLLLHKLPSPHPLRYLQIPPCLSARRSLSTPVLRSRTCSRRMIAWPSQFQWPSQLSDSTLTRLYSQLGFGTWQSAPGQVGEAVYEALKAGYRHLVCFHVWRLECRRDMLTIARILLLCTNRPLPCPAALNRPIASASPH